MVVIWQTKNYQKYSGENQMRDPHNESVHPAMQYDENLMEPPVSMMLERMIDITGEF